MYILTIHYSTPSPPHFRTTYHTGTVYCCLWDTPLQTVPEGLHRKPEAEAPSPRPTINSVNATIVALGKASSVFQGSRAYMFATDVVSAEKEGNVEFFAARLYAYNNVCRLDAWYLR